MTTIEYRKGDVLVVPEAEKPLVIAHICNNVSKWGAGFTKALSARWPGPEKIYRELAGQLFLGQCQLVEVESGITVCNVVAQEGVRKYHGQRCINYHSLREGMEKLQLWMATAVPALDRIHMPKIGAGLGGGDWEIISKIVEESFNKETKVCIYELC
jgi:O-acetyl-ADP-ribose deacetylase (regulator of RNase III)